MFAEEPSVTSSLVSSKEALNIDATVAPEGSGSGSSSTAAKVPVPEYTGASFSAATITEIVSAVSPIPSVSVEAAMEMVDGAFVSVV